MRDVDEVKTFAKGGDAAGAVGTGVKTVRKRATPARKQARKQAKRVRRQLAAQIPDRATLERAARGAGSTAQGLLAERVLEARRELARRIDPEPRRRRWPWLLLLLAVGGVATAAALARRPQPVDEVGFGRSAARPPVDQSAVGAAEGNGEVGADRPSAATE